jgi:hypothetical protein
VISTGARAEGRVVDVDEQALRDGLVPGVHLVEGAHLPGRDAELGQALQQQGSAGQAHLGRSAGADVQDRDLGEGEVRGLSLAIAGG